MAKNNAHLLYKVLTHCNQITMADEDNRLTIYLKISLAMFSNNSGQWNIALIVFLNKYIHNFTHETENKETISYIDFYRRTGIRLIDGHLTLTLII